MPGRVVFAPRALRSFLEKDRGFPERNIGCNAMLFTEDLAFSCTKPTNIYTFLGSLGFSQKIPQRMQNKTTCLGMFRVSCIVF